MTEIPDSSLTADWQAVLDRIGAVRIVGVALDNSQLLAVGCQLGRVSQQAISRHPELYEANGVQRVVALQAPAKDAFGKALRSASRADFPLHTDQSFLPAPCRYVLLHCWQAAVRGGETLLANGKQLLARADRNLQLALSQYRFRYAFGESTTEAAIWRFSAEDIRVDMPRDAHWRDAIAAHLAAHASPLMLAQGDLLIIDNHRWLHGRTAFEGERMLKRLRADHGQTINQSSNSTSAM